MKAYIKEIGGRVHPLNGDAHYAATIRDIHQNEWGLFMVADGLSGSNSTIASHLAVEHIGKKLSLVLETGSLEDYHALIKDAVLSAHDALKAVSALIVPEGKDSLLHPTTITTCTTLDLVLLSKKSPNGLYLAHLGDSKVYLIYDQGLKCLTPDEGHPTYGPTNYLGKAYIEGDRRPIASRINIIEPYKRGLTRPKGILLATDGLNSRVTDGEIESACLKLSPYYAPPQILEELGRAINLPRGKMLEYPAAEDIRREFLYGITDFQAEAGLSKEELVGKILEAYVQRASEKLVKRIDEVHLKFDDATMVFVDLEDYLDNSLNRLKKYVSVTLPKCGKMIRQTREEAGELKGEVEELSNARERRGCVINELCQKVNELSSKYEALSKHYVTILNERNQYCDEAEERLKTINEWKPLLEEVDRIKKDGAEKHPMKTWYTLFRDYVNNIFTPIVNSVNRGDQWLEHNVLRRAEDLWNKYRQ